MTGSDVPDDQATNAGPRGRASGFDDRGRVKRTRVSAVWVGTVTAAVLAVLVLIFIAQNSDSVPIIFLWMNGTISLAVALLAALVVGVLIVAIPGSARILQLRRSLQKNERTARTGDDPRRPDQLS